MFDHLSWYSLFSLSNIVAVLVHHAHHFLQKYKIHEARGLRLGYSGERLYKGVASAQIQSVSGETCKSAAFAIIMHTRRTSSSSPFFVKPSQVEQAGWGAEEADSKVCQIGWATEHYKENGLNQGNEVVNFK